MSDTQDIELPKDPHIFTDTVEIARPRHILEIGFFNGSSAAFMLANSEAQLISVDPLGGEDHIPGMVEKVMALFPRRFTFIQKRSQDVHGDLVGQSFDLIFIDGDHRGEAVNNDFALAISLGIPYALVDDWNGPVVDTWRDHFQTRWPIIKTWDRTDRFNGEPIKMVLCKLT